MNHTHTSTVEDSPRTSSHTRDLEKPIDPSVDTLPVSAYHTNDTSAQEEHKIEEEAAGAAVPIQDGPSSDEPIDYPSGIKLFLILTSILLAMFLVALDRTIIVTAIPQITDDFKSLGDVGWYGSAYLLTGCSFQLLFGKIYTYYNIKWVFLSTIVLFEAGSAICGAAPTSVAFIVGRAIAGLGSAGIFSGAIIIMVYSIPLHKRPLYQGLFGGVFGLASVIGPLLGGVFTSKVTWRWCFYINLPVGGVTLVILFFILHIKQTNLDTRTFKQQMMSLDPLGQLCLMPGIVCILLALQWGGSTYPWNSSRVIALLVLGACLLITFVALQFRGGENATIPPRIAGQRSIAAAMYYALCLGSTMMVIIYYMPIWFQAIEGISAFDSGIRMIALVLSLVLASISSGIFTAKVGYYVPAMFLSSSLMAIGAGLLSTLETDSGEGKWLGFQVLFGLGLGFGMQQPGMATQTVLSRRDISVGTSLVFFMQFLGGAIFISVAQNIFANKLVSNLTAIQGIPVALLDPSVVVNLGATQLRTYVPAQYLPLVLKAYNGAVTNTFYLAVALASCSIFGAFAMEWKSVKKAKAEQDAAQAARQAKTSDENVASDTPAAERKEEIV